MKILIVEDYPKINQLLAMFLRQDGYQVTQVFNGNDALSEISKSKFEIILLDLMLPDMSGETIIQKVRQNSDVYIMVISAKVDINDRVDVLNLGADDFLTKPFSMNEVSAKIKNVVKRLHVNAPTVYSFNQQAIKISPLTRQVTVHGRLVDLTKSEYDILWLLSSHPNQIFSRESILNQCFVNSDAFDRVIDSLVKNIRKKIDKPEVSSLIKTHYGVGYQFAGNPDD